MGGGCSQTNVVGRWVPVGVGILVRVRGAGEEFGDGVGGVGVEDEGFVGQAGAAAEEQAEAGLFQGFGDVADEGVGALDGDGEDGAGEVVAVGDECGLGAFSAGAFAGVDALFAWVAAAHGVVVAVGGAGLVDADGEGEVAVAGCGGSTGCLQVGVGGEGVFAGAALGCGEHADELGAGGEGAGVAVVEDAAFTGGLERACQAQDEPGHGWCAGVRAAVASVAQAAARSSKDVWWVPRVVRGLAVVLVCPWAMRWRVPSRRLMVAA